MNNYLFPLLTDETALPLYVKGVGGLQNQVDIIRPSGYPDYQWLHCVKGKGILLIDNKEFIIPKNAGFFMCPNIPHEYHALDESWETHWVTFDGIGVPSLLSTLGFNIYRVHYFDDIGKLDSLIFNIYDISVSNGLMAGYKRSAKLYTLLIELKTLIRETEERSDSTRLKKLQPVLSYIEENYNKSPTIEDMASIIEVSPQYLCRIFKKVLSTRPFMYLNLYRLQKAKEILLNFPDLTVKDVSEKVGFNDPSYFCSIFKRNEGLTPDTFREIHKIS